MAAALLLAAASSVHAARTDVIELVNGDAVTGEIKKLDRGILTYKTDSAGTLNVEWEDVVSLTSADIFEVDTVSGGRFFGSLERVERDAPSVRVVGAEDQVDLFLENVIKVIPIKTSLLQRLDGSVSLGYSFTQASGVGQASLGARVDYRTWNFVTGIGLSSNVTTQPELPTTARNDLTYYFEQLRLHRWFTRWSASAQTNDEIGLDRRLQVSWLGGRYALQSNNNLLSVGGGLAVSTEMRVGEEQSTENLDLVVNLDYQTWRFTTPKRDVTTSLYTYPSLTAWGRVRSDLDATVRFELVVDFFLDISLYASYDNKPPEGAASTLDYGWTTGLSWSF